LQRGKIPGKDSYIVMWLTFILALLVVIAAVVAALSLGGRNRNVAAHTDAAKGGKEEQSRRQKSAVRPVHLLLAGVFAGLVILFYPLELGSIVSVYPGNILTAFFVSIVDALQVFTVNASFELINEADSAGAAYKLLASVLYVAAPVIATGFLLSHLKGFVSMWRRFLCRNRDAYVFSELNLSALALAKSILSLSDGRKRTIVFANAFSQDTDAGKELQDQAESLDAILLKEDITSMVWKSFSPHAALNFFVMGKNEADNPDTALRLMEKIDFGVFGNRSDHRNVSPDSTSVYVFTDSASSEMVLAGRGKNVKLRRIDTTESVIFRTLYESGTSIFDSASAASETGAPRRIVAVLFGLGRHGTHMLKALVWFAQMDGFELTIHAFDADPEAETRFRMECPELMGDENHEYDITIHPDMDVSAVEYAEKVDMGTVTYAFAAMGDDEKNLNAAVGLHTRCMRKGAAPFIQAVIYDPEKKKVLADAANYKDQRYGIDFIGDLETRYSYHAIIRSDLEEAALARHLAWSSPETIEKDTRKFYQYEYFYRSSIATVIHRKMRVYCGIPGIDKPKQERTEEEKLICRVLEHKRWNAYMRSEGWIYGSVRNDLAKVHNCLVPFDDLSEEEKAKDDD